MNIGGENMVVNEFRNGVMDTYEMYVRYQLWVEIKNGSLLWLPLD